MAEWLIHWVSRREFKSHLNRIIFPPFLHFPSYPPLLAYRNPYPNRRPVVEIKNEFLFCQIPLIVIEREREKQTRLPISRVEFELARSPLIKEGSPSSYKTCRPTGNEHIFYPNLFKDGQHPSRLECTDKTARTSPDWRLYSQRDDLATSQAIKSASPWLPTILPVPIQS